MSIKIIDNTPDPSVVKRIVCNNCGVKLEYTPSDVKTVNGTDYSGGPDGCDYIPCPKCSKRVVIRAW